MECGELLNRDALGRALPHARRPAALLFLRPPVLTSRNDLMSQRQGALPPAWPAQHRFQPAPTPPPIPNARGRDLRGFVSAMTREGFRSSAAEGFGLVGKRGGDRGGGGAAAAHRRARVRPVKRPLLPPPPFPEDTTQTGTGWAGAPPHRHLDSPPPPQPRIVKGDPATLGHCDVGHLLTLSHVTGRIEDGRGPSEVTRRVGVMQRGRGGFFLRTRKFVFFSRFRARSRATPASLFLYPPCCYSRAQAGTRHLKRHPQLHPGFWLEAAVANGSSV